MFSIDEHAPDIDVNGIGEPDSFGIDGHELEPNLVGGALLRGRRGHDIAKRSVDDLDLVCGSKPEIFTKAR